VKDLKEEIACPMTTSYNVLSTT